MTKLKKRAVRKLVANGRVTQNQKNSRRRGSAPPQGARANDVGGMQRRKAPGQRQSPAAHLIRSRRQLQNSRRGSRNAPPPPDRANNVESLQRHKAPGLR